MIFRILCQAIAVLATAAMAHAAEHTIRWGKHVEVTGLDAASLRALEKSAWSPAQWQRLLSVYADQGSIITDLGIPAMAGTYHIEGKNLRFTPQFSFQPNINYRAVFRPEALPDKTGSGLTLSSTHRISAPAPSSTTVVSAIHPTIDAIPENVLKFYLLFSTPMSGGGVYQHIQLLNAAGNEVELPFLELEQELWDPSMTRLTLLLDPGRIKRGLKPLEEVGPAIQQGKSFTLVVSRQWRDAAGAPLKSDFQKKFTVVAADRESPIPTRWKIAPPKSKSRSPVTVSFDEPLDHAIAERVLRVANPTGAHVAGTVKLDDQDRAWTFVPDDRWKPGLYHLVVPTRIEDLAGNNIAKSFDVDPTEGPRAAIGEVVKLSFTVR